MGPAVVSTFTWKNPTGGGKSWPVVQLGKFETKQPADLRVPSGCVFVTENKLSLGGEHTQLRRVNASERRRRRSRRGWTNTLEDRLVTNAGSGWRS